MHVDTLLNSSGEGPRLVMEMALRIRSNFVRYRQFIALIQIFHLYILSVGFAIGFRLFIMPRSANSSLIQLARLSSVFCVNTEATRERSLRPLIPPVCDAYVDLEGPC
jgi:hypothetical protein